jgi:hypothetical protein
MADLAALRKVRDELKVDLQEALEAFKESHPTHRALQGVESAIAALEAGEAPPLPLADPRTFVGPSVPATTTIGIALEAIRQSGKPLSTAEIFAVVNRFKKFENPRKGKINVVSAMSKDRRLKSLVWNGQYAWWPVGDPLPNGLKSEARP